MWPPSYSYHLARHRSFFEGSSKDLDIFIYRIACLLCVLHIFNIGYNSDIHFKHTLRSVYIVLVMTIVYSVKYMSI